MSNKRVDRVEVGANFPQAPNDEVVWIDVETNNINRYDENTNEWVSVGGSEGINFVVGPSNQRTGEGEVLQFTDETKQSVITGPSPTVSNSTAQRLVIAGQDGLVDTSGEGGDVYLWGGAGGSSNGSGGDIKVDAGNGGGTTGGGGTVKVRGGYSTESSGGQIQIEAGDSSLGNGGQVYIDGGNSSEATGGHIYVNAGDNYVDTESYGGSINLRAGSSGNTMGGGSVNIETYQAGKITLSGDGGEFLNDPNVADNQIATIGDLPSGVTSSFNTATHTITVTNGIITAIDAL